MKGFNYYDFFTFLTSLSILLFFFLTPLYLANAGLAPPESACCFSNGTCMEENEEECFALGGEYQGDGTICEPNLCLQTMTVGACCLTDQCLNDQTAEDCAVQGGVYQGDDSICELSDCDLDGVPNGFDFCFGTVIPEATVPSVRLGVNRYALTYFDTTFDTASPRGRGPNETFTTTDTCGCSCEQIINILDLDSGHVKFGCSLGNMRFWISLVGDCLFGDDDDDFITQ